MWAWALLGLRGEARKGAAWRRKGQLAWEDDAFRRPKLGKPETSHGDLWETIFSFFIITQTTPLSVLIGDGRPESADYADKPRFHY